MFVEELKPRPESLMVYILTFVSAYVTLNKLSNRR